MDLISWVIVKNPDGKIIAEGSIKSIHCEDGLMTIQLKNPEIIELKIIDKVQLRGFDHTQKPN